MFVSTKSEQSGSLGTCEEQGSLFQLPAPGVDVAHLRVSVAAMRNSIWEFKKSFVPGLQDPLLWKACSDCWIYLLFVNLRMSSIFRLRRRRFIVVWSSHVSKGQ